MRSSRVVLSLLLAAATLLLGGCYVATKNLPAGAEFIDTQLVGAWEALNEDGKPSGDATFLHFLKGDEGKPLTVVMVDDHSANTYEMRSIKLGKRQVFALKPLTSTTHEPQSETNYILGFYEVKGPDLSFNLLDAKKLKALVEANKVKGVAEKSDYGKVTLTGSPQEVADFLANADLATIVGGEKPARARRLTQPK
jgi:hypothetical protein